MKDLPPSRSVSCPEPGCGAPILLPASARERYATCSRCGVQLDRAKLSTNLGRTPPPADPTDPETPQRTCPECQTRTDERLCPACRCPTLLDQTEDTLVGRVLDDRFDVLERLGGGGFGTVYRARQLSMGRDVALKVVRSELKGRREIAQRFVREARLVSRLEHQNTIRVYEFGQAPDGELYLAMELLRGETLTARLDRLGRFAPAEAARTLAGVARSLVEAHAQGIVHRDLKPDNVFFHQPLGAGEVVKVLDFGIAKAAQGDPTLFETGSMRAIGTPHYMAPEQIRAEAVDGRTDLYALGVMLYELIAGQPPFDATAAEQILRMHETAEPPALPAGVPETLRALCRRLLSKRPDDRPASAEEVARILEAGSPPQSATVALQIGTPRRSRMGFWAVLTLAVGALSGGVYWAAASAGPDVTSRVAAEAPAPKAARVAPAAPAPAKVVEPETPPAVQEDAAPPAEAPETNLDKARVAFEEARTAKRRSDVPSAKAKYGECLALAPSMTACREGLIPLLMSEGLRCQALGHMRVYLKWNPGGPQAHKYERLIEQFEADCL